MSEFPSQTRNRDRWIIEAVRANQEAIGAVLSDLDSPDGERLTDAQFRLEAMHKMDRDAVLIPGGILTLKQIESLDETKE